MNTAKSKQPIVAIDGPAGVGKTTVARRVANVLGFTLVDTGALYRCVALAAEQRGIRKQDSRALGELAACVDVRFEQSSLGSRVWMDKDEVTEAIRMPHISQAASCISVYPEVRHALLEPQRKLGRRGGVVLEGRDIGTVVFPDAEIKVFLDASTEVRAKRRYKELQEKGCTVSLSNTLKHVRKRDSRDKKRTIAPLVPAQDAIRINTDFLDVQQVVEQIVRLIHAYKKHTTF